MTMNELVLSLVSFFLINPLQAELDRYLTEAKVPVELIKQVKDCAITAGPTIANRVTDDPGWAVSSIYHVWVGSAHPEDILVEAAPTCKATVDAVRPYLTGASV
jgi:hypothetical protein